MNGVRPVGRFGLQGPTMRPVIAFENNIYLFNTVTVRKLTSKCCLRQWISERCYAYEYQRMTVWVTGLKDRKASCSVFSETHLCYLRSDEACE